MGVFSILLSVSIFVGLVLILLVFCQNLVFFGYSTFVLVALFLKKTFFFCPKVTTKKLALGIYMEGK